MAIEVLLPINLDRWRHPIATALRETSLRIPDISFYSFSSPSTEEDECLGARLWARQNLHRVSGAGAFKRAFDVVHHASATNYNIAAALAARLRSFGSCQHVYTVQVEPFRHDIWYQHHRLCIRMAHRVVAVSQATADGVRKVFGRTVDAVIPNGVDVEFFSPAAARALDFDGLQIRSPYVLFVAQLEARKRPDVFIALSRLLPEIDFVMLGTHLNEAERDSYLALIRECPNVKFLGRRTRSLLRDLYAQAVALIFPSEIEGLPLSVVEAQAMGVPVLAQPKTCMPEIIQEGTTGWLLPAEPLERWASAVKMILAWSSAERSRYSEGARQLTMQRYSWDVIAPKYRELYLATNGTSRTQ